MIVVVTDTGPMLHLHQAGWLRLLKFIGEIHLVPAVWQELMRHAPDMVQEDLASWVMMDQPDEDTLKRAREWINAGLLDIGEAEALAHAQAIGAEMLLTDDTAARVVAGSFPMAARGSLGVILYAAAHGHLTRHEAESALSALETRSTLWLSSRVKKAARDALDQIFG